jgi:hypothetical protein
VRFTGVLLISFAKLSYEFGTELPRLWRRLVRVPALAGSGPWRGSLSSPLLASQALGRRRLLFPVRADVGADRGRPSYFLGPWYSTRLAFFIASNMTPGLISTVVFVTRICPGPIVANMNAVTVLSFGAYKMTNPSNTPNE